MDSTLRPIIRLQPGLDSHFLKWRRSLRGTQVLPFRSRDRRLTPSFLSFRARKSLCGGPGASGHKNRPLERVDFPFLTVSLLRKRLLHEIFFPLCFFFFSKKTFNGETKGLERSSFSPILFSLQNRLRRSCPHHHPHSSLLVYTHPLPPPPTPSASRFLCTMPHRVLKEPPSLIVGLITETSHTAI